MSDGDKRRRFPETAELLPAAKGQSPIAALMLGAPCSVLANAVLSPNQAVLSLSKGERRAIPANPDRCLPLRASTSSARGILVGGLDLGIGRHTKQICPEPNTSRPESALSYFKGPIEGRPPLQHSRCPTPFSLSPAGERV